MPSWTSSAAAKYRVEAATVINTIAECSWHFIRFLWRRSMTGFAFAIESNYNVMHNNYGNARREFRARLPSNHHHLPLGRRPSNFQSFNQFPLAWNRLSNRIGSESRHVSSGFAWIVSCNLTHNHNGYTVSFIIVCALSSSRWDYDKRGNSRGRKNTLLYRVASDSQYCVQSFCKAERLFSRLGAPYNVCSSCGAAYRRPSVSEGF